MWPAMSRCLNIILRNEPFRFQYASKFFPYVFDGADYNQQVGARRLDRFIMVATISTPVLFALLAFGQLVALIMVPLRVVARYKVVYQLAAEDYFMIVAEVCRDRLKHGQCTHPQ